MRGPDHRVSIFGQSQSRGSFLAYLLGAVVPLVALGIVIERYVLAPIETPGDRYSALGASAVFWLFTSIGFLTLACFLALRRLVWQSLAETHALAYYDSLTGLPNRRLFRDRVEQALGHARREGELVAICFLDLDGFKRVNDTFGHSVGDHLLCQVAERLVGSVRLGDSLARGDPKSQGAVSRLGGDEYTFLLSGILDPKDAGRVATRVLNALRAPFRVEDHEVVASASIGIAVHPLDGENAEVLLRNADTAMYWAKDRGRNNYQFYSEQMNQAAKRRLELELRLRHVFECDALSLHYQPVRETESGRVVAAEALLRWEDPELGPIAPAEFVPIAEEAGLMPAIGDWVIRAACGQARVWQDAGYRPIHVAVNVSARQLRQPDFAATVAETLRATGISPAHLEIEITESAIMQDDSITTTSFRELQGLGVEIVLDDFGTGYSSLSYLRRPPIGKVKIESSFVAELPENRADAALIAAIIAMAHNLGLKVVAEGVEAVEQATFLSGLRCDYLQGYLFGKPVAAESFARFLELEKPLASEPAGTR